MICAMKVFCGRAGLAGALTPINQSIQIFVYGVC